MDVQGMWVRSYLCHSLASPLRAGIRPFRGGQGPQNGLFWPKCPLLNPVEVPDIPNGVPASPIISKQHVADQTKMTKKKWKKAVRLTAWVDPPSPEAVRKMWKFFDKLSYLGLFCHFIKEKMGQNFHKIEAVRRSSGQPDRFFPVFFLMASL